MTTFNFDIIKSCENKKHLLDMFEADLTMDGYKLSLNKISNTVSIFMIDTLVPTTLLVYTKCMNINFPDTIQYDEQLIRSPEKQEATNYQIYLMSLYLGAYKSVRNTNYIPKELIDFTYELLIAIHNEEKINLQMRQSDEKRRDL